MLALLRLEDGVIAQVVQVFFFEPEFVFRARTTRHRGGHESKLRTVGSFLAWPLTFHPLFLHHATMFQTMGSVTLVLLHANINSIDCTVSTTWGSVPRGAR
jgi:hypothetical protein